MVYGMLVLDRKCTIKDHVNKILRSLPIIWIPNDTTIHEAKDLIKLRQ